VTPSNGEQPLHIPYWALDPAELLSFLMGKLDDKPLIQILERVLDHRGRTADAAQIAGADLSSMTVDSPSRSV